MMFGLGAAEWGAVALSLKVSLWATIVSLPLALLTAHALARGRFFGKAALNIAVHLPLLMPPVVTGYLLLVLFGTQGPLGRFFALFGVEFAGTPKLQANLNPGPCGRLDGLNVRWREEHAHRRAHAVLLGRQRPSELGPLKYLISND